MTLYFVTGNKNKFAEAKKVLPQLEQLALEDLPEIQELDSHKIIAAKLAEAMRQHPGELIVEDVSFRMDCLGGFPGPLIKWLLKSVGNKGIYEIADRFQKYDVEVACLIGYADNNRETHFFEGKARGTIVVPQGEERPLWWDTIFLPEGSDRRYSELTPDEKIKISHRGQAFAQLREYLRHR